MFSLFPSRTVALIILGFPVHWYGLLYVFAFLIAWALLPMLQKYRHLSLSNDDWSFILSGAVIGVLAGGRLGYVLFYAPEYFFMHPFQIFAVWNGGMSSHGGFIGVGIALLVVSRMKRIPLLTLLDVIVVPAAIGLACGRVGNFINQELYGIPTSLPWGIAIPGIEGLRHPTQIYAVIKDLFIAGVCFLHLRRSRDTSPGGTFALFLILYGALRFLMEYLRVQDYSGITLGVVTLTRGQLLTIPLIIVGMGITFWRKSSAKTVLEHN
ncbi:MAG: prolipoprotein diacylglyceryl transferase [Candidatus Peregrinibacteria bacterium]